MKQALALALLLSCTAAAQTNAFTPVSATNLTIAGVPIVNGTLTITPVDQANGAIPIRTADNQQYLPGPALTAAITSGAIASGLQVPDQCTARSVRSASAIGMLVTVSGTANGKTYQSSFTSLPSAPFFCGSATVAINTYSQPLTATVMGAGLITTATLPAHCTAPSLWYAPSNPSALYSCANGVYVAVAGTGGGGGGSLTAAATPTASPVSGAITSSTTVAFASSTPSPVLYFTSSTSGTPADPTTSSPLYSAPVTPGVTTNYKVLACATGYSCSAIASFAYTVTSGGSGSSFVGPQTAPLSAMALGTNANMNGFKPFCPSPTNCSDIYRNISSLPVDTVRNTAFHSGAYNYENSVINVDAAGDLTNSMEYHVVKPSTDSSVKFIQTATNYSYANNFAYDSQSIDAPFPWTTGFSTEGANGFDTCGVQSRDVHPQAINIDTGYEFESYVGAGGQGGICGTTWLAYQTTVWNLNQPIEGQLPGGQTSTDAAGLPIFGLTVRYEDLVNGANHAVRMTVPHLGAAFYSGDVYGLTASPARHSAAYGGGFQTYTGQRLRLPASKNITACGVQAQSFLQGLKDYGVIVADQGNAGEVQAVYDSRMDAAQFACVAQNFHVSDLEVVLPQPLRGVDLTPEQPTFGASVYYDETGMTTTSGSGPQGTLIPNVPVPPTITTFTASQSTVALGQTVTLTATATNAKNLIVKNGGPMVGGSLVVKPTETTTYLLTAYNGNGYETSGRSGGSPSPVVTVTGTQAAVPTVDVAGGNYTINKTITITPPTGGQVRYTLDGSAPNANSTTYTAPIPATTGTTTLRYQTFGLAGYIPSAPVTQTYVVTNAPNPVASLATGTYTGTQSLTYTGAGVHYSTTGVADCSSTAYTGAISVATTTTFSAINCPTGSNPSGVDSATITVSGTAALAPVVVQFVSSNSYDASPRTTTPMNITAGNMILIALVWHDTATPPSSVTCGGQTATQIVNVSGESGRSNYNFYSISSATGGSTTCTFVDSAASSFYHDVMEISGTHGVDAFSSGVGATTLPHVNCGSLTTTGTNRLGLSFGGRVTDTASASSGYTLINTSGGYGLASINIPSATAMGMTIDSTATSNQACVSVALKP